MTAARVLTAPGQVALKRSTGGASVADLPETSRANVMEPATFLTILAVAAAPRLHSDELRAALRTLDPTRTYRVAETELPHGEAGRCLLTEAEEVQFTILARPDAPQAAAFARALQDAALAWRGAEAAVRGARAQIIVAAASPAADHAAAVKIAYLLTVVSEAVARLARPLFVYWGTGDLLVDPAAFSEAAKAMLHENRPPVLQWVRFSLFRGPGSGASATGGMRSKGLAPFLGYELKLEPVAMPPVEIARRAIGYAEHLLREGPAARVEEIDGPAPGERMSLEIESRPQGPVLRMRTKGPR